MRYNAEQNAFIGCDAPRVLVLAAAGSGKTKSCIGYVLRRVNQGVTPESILQVTFTRKAAGEFAERLTQASGIERDAFSVGTYHSIASDLIREDPQGFGFSAPPTIVDGSETTRVLSASWERIDGQPWPEDAGRITEVFSFYRNSMRPPAVAKQFGLHRHMPAVLQELHDHFQRTNTTDFDMLLECWRSRLLHGKGYAQSVRQRWSHIIVDEMQDNNLLNYDIVTAINPRTLVCVGDVNQSIYEWRGASPGIVERFKTEHKAQVLTMETNYRSRQRILDLANASIKNESTRLVMRSGVGDGGALWFRSNDDAMGEAQDIVAFIKRRIEAGASPASIAVLGRTNRVLRPTEFLLEREHIEYVTYSGDSNKDSAASDLGRALRAILSPSDAKSRGLLAAIERGKSASESPVTDAMIADGRSIASDSLVREMPAVMYHWLSKCRPADAKKRHRLISKMCSEKADMFPGEFVSWMTLSAEAEEQREHPETAVTLSTIHSAKGLEWDSVWVAGLGARQFSVRGQACSEKENIRLFYVAATRAKSQIVLSYPRYTKAASGAYFPQKPIAAIPEIVRWTHVDSEQGHKRVAQGLGIAATASPKPFTKTGWDFAREESAKRAREKGQ